MEASLVEIVASSTTTGAAVIGLVCGGAWNLWDDLAKLEQLVGGVWPGWVGVVNNVGWAYQHPIDAWITLHPSNLPEWRAKREAAGFSMDFDIWGGVWRTGTDDSNSPLVDHVLPVTRVGSSGYHAVEVALHLGCERVVLAGVPMEFGPHFHSKKPWDSPMFHRPAWEASVEDFDGRVRSMSGWTAELLGTPDAEWLGILEGERHG